MRDTKVQWHPGFVAAMNLELLQSQGSLEFRSEYNLNTKPLEIDLLVIKKKAADKIENDIGRIFQGHNIMEYKSPEDHLDIDAFYKAMAYASLYKSYGETLDAIKARDVTVSLVREARPEGLLRYFEEHHFTVSKPYPGIYYIGGMTLFQTQVVVTRELASGEHIWLRALSNKMETQDMRFLLESVRQLEQGQGREFADSVLEVSLQANGKLVEKLMGDERMSEALLEIMKPIIEPMMEEATKKARNQGVQQGIKQEKTNVVVRMYESGLPVEQIAQIAQYSVSEVEDMLKKVQGE